MIASGMVLSNLLYVVGAIVAATVVSGIVLLRHRRPKSLEAGIEMFSRELRALQPDGPGASVRGGGAVHGTPVPGGAVQGGAVQGGAVQGGAGRGSRAGQGGAGRGRAGRTVTPLVGSLPTQAASAGHAEAATVEPAEEGGRYEARAPSPYRENGSG